MSLLMSSVTTTSVHYIVRAAMRQTAYPPDPTQVVVHAGDIFYLGGYNPQNAYQPAWTLRRYAHRFACREDAIEGFHTSKGLPWMFDPIDDCAEVIRVTETTTEEAMPMEPR